MKWLLLITLYHYTDQMEPRRDNITYIKSFESKEACEAVGKEIVGHPHSDVRLDTKSFQCIEER